MNIGEMKDAMPIARADQHGADDDFFHRRRRGELPCGKQDPAGNDTGVIAEQRAAECGDRIGNADKRVVGLSAERSSVSPAEATTPLVRVARLENRFKARIPLEQSKRGIDPHVLRREPVGHLEQLRQWVERLVGLAGEEVDANQLVLSVDAIPFVAATLRWCLRSSAR